MITPEDGGKTPIPVPSSATITEPAPKDTSGSSATPTIMAANPANLTKPKVPKFDPQKSFQSTKTVDRMKEYLKKIPVYDAQLKSILTTLEQAVSDVNAAKIRFEQVTKEIENTVKQWDEEQKHAGIGEQTSGGSSSTGDRNTG